MGGHPEKMVKGFLGLRKIFSVNDVMKSIPTDPNYLSAYYTGFCLW